MCDPTEVSSVRYVADNLARVRERIARAADRVGRSPEEVTLVAVTKGRTDEEIAAVVAAGVGDLGENRVDRAATLRRMADGLRSPGGRARIHLVGHLQRNKLARAWGTIDVLHSLDSVALAEKIAARAERGAQGHSGELTPSEQPCARLPFEVLVQVNVTREPQKHGILPEDVEASVATIVSLGIVPRGLMCMSRLGASEAEHRANFETLARLAADVSERLQVPLRELSMGMSDDFEQAVEAGATMVRIGRAIFEKE